MNAQQIIDKLDLKPLPKEGGFFKETGRSKKTVSCNHLGEKVEYTSIYYLITSESFSALHTVQQDEIFHFYAGSPVEMLQIDDSGSYRHITLGNDLNLNHEPQVIVPRGTWQGTKLLDQSANNWALLGCTVAPGFDFDNFGIKSRSELIDLFPNLEKEIIPYTN